MSTKKVHSKAESIKTVNTNDLRQDKSMLWTLMFRCVWSRRVEVWRMMLRCNCSYKFSIND